MSDLVMKDSLLPYPKREQPVFLHWVFYSMTVSSFGFQGKMICKGSL